MCVCGREEDGGLPLLQMIENKRIIYFCVCGEIGDIIREKKRLFLFKVCVMCDDELVVEMMLFFLCVCVCEEDG